MPLERQAVPVRVRLSAAQEEPHQILESAVADGAVEVVVEEETKASVLSAIVAVAEALHLRIARIFSVPSRVPRTRSTQFPIRTGA